jgi:hypothetical protein
MELEKGTTGTAMYFLVLLQYVVAASLPCVPACFNVMCMQHSFHQLRRNTAGMLAVLGSWPSTLEVLPPACC